MSCDLFFFRLPDGISSDAISGFLESDEFEAYGEECSRREEMGLDEDLPLIPERFIDMTLAEDEILDLLETACEELGRPELMTELQDALEDASLDEGMLQVCMGYGSFLPGRLALFAEILKRLQAQRIAVYLDGLDHVYDGSDADAMPAAALELARTSGMAGWGGADEADECR